MFLLNAGRPANATEVLVNFDKYFVHVLFSCKNPQFYFLLVKMFLAISKIMSAL